MNLNGVYTAIITPFKKGNVDMEALMTLVQRQIDAGIHGIILTGTTGEAATMTNSEKQDVYKEVVNKFSGKTQIIAGTGTNNTAVTIENSLAAQEAGVDGLLIVSPYYNKPSQAGVIQHYKAVAEKVKLPIILYNVPSRTQNNINVETAGELAKIDNIVAIKEAGTFTQMNEMIRLNGDKLAILSGDDFTFMPFLALGGNGVISVASNVLPDEMLAIYNAVKDKDLETARSVHHKLYPLFDMLFLESNPVPTKLLLNHLGLMEKEVRLPLVDGSSENEKKILDVFKQIHG